MHIHGSAGRVTLLPCDDIVLLSKLYIELMEDERYDGYRTDDEYQDHMAAHLRSGEVAYTFNAEECVVGYALVNVSRAPFYLHHFYICRDARRQGYGREAFHALLTELGTETMDLDVFVWNERGKAFWNSLGFTPRSIIMRYQTGYDHN